MSTKKIFLLNTRNTQLLLNLELQRSVASATLRRGRTQPTPIRLPPSGRVELCAYLGLSKEEVLAVLEKSKELKSFQNGSIRILDPDAPRQKAKPKDIITLTDAAKKEELWREKRRKELEAEKLAQSRGKDKLDMQVGMDLVITDNQEEETSGPVAGEALEPGMMEKMSDALPSTKWTKTQLANYARERGIDVDGLSKNAILRKIREA